MRSENSDLHALLIRQAVRLLDEGGVELSLRSVARGAGVSAMAPYRHFTDKAALLGAAAEQGFAELREALEAADLQAEGWDALLGQGLAYIAFAQQRPNLFRLMFASPETACIPQDAARTAYDVLARRVATMAPDRHEFWTLGCWALVHGLATLRLEGRAEVGLNETTVILKLFTQGITGR